MRRSSRFKQPRESAVKILEVYREVWRIFHDNVDTVSRRTLLNLNGLPEAQDAGYTHELLATVPAECQDTGRLSEGAEEIFTEFTIRPDRTVSASTIRVDATASSEEIFQQSPLYEQCTPLLDNIRHGDDPSSLPFIPYADDQTFKLQAYASEYHEVGWRNCLATLDIFWISLETARRVAEDYNMTVEEIDEACILQSPLSKPSRHWRQVWISRNSQCPPWLQPNMPSYEGLVGAYYATVCNAHKSLQSVLSVFCSNLNCIQAYCWTHESEGHDFDNDIRYEIPAGIPQSPHPCENSCYLLKGRSCKSSFSEDDEANLENMFRIFPEGSPCELSALMRIPCDEVHALRATVLSRPRKKARQESDEPDMKHIPEKYDPCSHPGPCDPTNEECTCYASGTYCERTCCCALSCPRRWQGCNCAMERGQKVKLCSLGRGRNCPCFNVGRQCDPELCDCFYHPGVTCTNSDLRRGLHKQIKVASSAYGFGAFLTEPVRKDELICEYTGELIFGGTSTTRDIIARHRGRSYLYALNEPFDVDASYAGNIARFINHASKSRSNCMSRIKVVSGDHRIGLYAKRQMTAGTELLLDYGDEFFPSDKTSQKSAAPPGPSKKKSRQKNPKRGTA